MKTARTWAEGPMYWTEGNALFVSVAFTWQLPEVRQRIERRIAFDVVRIGGSAVDLMPGYFEGIRGAIIGGAIHGMLQRWNPLATRTSAGCVRRCRFCAVPKTEGSLVEFADWPNLPVICDNNLLATSQPHFDRVIERLRAWEWADFNQGLDARLLTEYHARRIAEIRKPVVRLALDSMGNVEAWDRAFTLLRSAGVPKAAIRSYALIGFNSGPDEAWRRCEWIEAHGVKPLPMWFHELDALTKNSVTERQKHLGWSDFERRRIMQWFYQHKQAVTA